MDRRTFCSRLAAAGVAVTAGCGGGEEPTGTPTTFPTNTPSSSPSPSPTASPTAGGGVTEVAAGPEGRLRFVPDQVEIAVGDTVRWTFESPGHNVTTRQGASEKVRIPEGAEPFASYEDDQHFAIVPEGETFEHTFTVAGEYVYVCAPHADQGMVGTVVVTATPTG